MNSKTKTYLLLTGVLLIWGIIGYKIVTGINPDVPEIKHEEFNTSFNPKLNKNTDTFSIQKTSRDPFLGTLTKNNDGTKKTQKSTSDSKKEDLKTITYKGLVKKQNTYEKVFVLLIDNSEYLLKVGQSADKVKLVSGNTESIKVLENKSYRTIKRQ